MPTLPAALAEPMTRWMGRPASVSAVETLSPGLIRVAFTGPALQRRDWVAGSEIEFRVSAREFRHYTPAAFDDETGRIDVVFQLHGAAPGTDWVRRLRPGDEVLVLGPGGRPWLRPGQHPVFAGDGSALGLFAALLAGLGADAEPTGVVEVPAADVAAAAALVPGLTVVPAAEAPGDATARWLSEHQAASDVAYLAGHAQSIQRHRALLRERRAPMQRRNVVTKPFWSTGKTGL